MADHATPPKSRRTVVGISVFLVAITWLVFGQTLGHDFINQDDPEYVFANPHVTSGLSLQGIGWAFTRIHSNNWHPLTWISHMLDCQLFGLNPTGHHLTNVLLHTITVLLLFLLLHEMTGALWSSGVVAALFAIHPLRAESVAWIAERKDVLSAVFFMLTLAAYVRYARKETIGRYIAMSIFFALGLMSKPMLVTVPFILLLLDYWPLGRGSGSRKLILEKVPLFALSAASCAITLIAQKDAINSLERLPLGARIGNAVLSCAIYLRQMIWPVRLANVYPPVEKGMSVWSVLLAVSLLVFISIGVFALRRKRPYALTGWLWYMGMLLPVIGVIQVGLQPHADRYTYLPQIGLSIALTWGIADLSDSWRYRRQILGVATVLLLGVLIWRASIQVSYWRDSESLWQHTLATSSQGGDVHYALGNALLQKNDLDGAVSHYQKALESSSVYAAETHNNLGNVLLRKGQVDAAIAQFETALELKPDRLEEAHYNLGNALLQKGSTSESIVQFQKVLEISPNHLEARNNLAGILLQQGKVDEAIAHFQKILEQQPNHAKAHNNLGNALLQKGRIDEAILHYQKALELPFDHSEAHYNIGNALLRKGQIDDAIAHYRKAVELRPAYLNAHNNLANALRQKGLLREAIFHFQKALESDPASILIQSNLAWVLATCSDSSLRNGAKAVELAEQANHVSGGNNPIVLHTLAAAYAENGQFPRALDSAQRALTLADAQGNTSLADSLRREIALYQAGLPYHEPSK